MYADAPVPGGDARNRPAKDEVEVEQLFQARGQGWLEGECRIGRDTNGLRGNADLLQERLRSGIANRDRVGRLRPSGGSA